MVKLSMVSWIVIGMATVAHAQTVEDISNRVAASVSVRGTVAQFDIISPEGWSCTGKSEVPSGKSSNKGSRGGSSGSSYAASNAVRLTCSDGTRASARVTRDATRREWDIAFTHRQHGRASLRAVEN
jgi:hypothetical protein